MTASAKPAQYTCYISDDETVGWLEDSAGNVREVSDASIRRQRLIDSGAIRPRHDELTWLPQLEPCLWLHSS